jgi:alpha-galactosidase
VSSVLEITSEINLAFENKETEYTLEDYTNILQLFTPTKYENYMKRTLCTMKTKLIILLLTSTLTAGAQMYFGTKKEVPDSVFNALAQTPPMGWNSWNKFGCNVSEQLIKEMADAMIATGMKDAGYEYLVIDDCWQVGRDEEGNIQVDPKRFPNGMKALADYVHAKGLKMGIYSCAGSETCQGRPGSRGYQFQDARTYAAWGIDYLKYDWCSNEGQKAEAAYRTMSDALKACGRPIVFSICEWGENEPWKWGKGIGHLWRITPDIRDCYQCVFDWGGVGVLDIIDKMADLYPYAGPGHWNDAEMLEVGNGGMTRDEYITHFSMWCMLAAPLMSGNDLRNMDKETIEILTNKEVIAINQDKKGEQARRFMDMGEKEIWAKPLNDGELAVCFMNRTENSWKLDYDWKKQTIYFADEVNIHRKEYKIRDLWQHKDIGTTERNTRHEIPAHGVLMVRLTPTK